ncbi:6904_t:CDS:2 [Rhizophagus irregularis]|nr:6904_t:CDS:2 [Rhizophagus irregularis]
MLALARQGEQGTVIYRVLPTSCGVKIRFNIAYNDMTTQDPYEFISLHQNHTDIQTSSN